MTRNHLAHWAVAALLGAAYVLVLDRSALLLQDYPSHLARAYVMADLVFHHGAQFGQVFQFHFMAVPYIVGDLLLMLAVEICGPSGATAIWMALLLLSLPFAVLFYLRITRTAVAIRPVFFILCLYLSTDWFFLLGFTHFRLAVALVFVALALAEGLRRRWSSGLFAAYLAVVVFGYLMHLAFVVFAGAALGASGLLKLFRRTSSFHRELLLFVPIVVVLAWHFGAAAFYPDRQEVIRPEYLWGTLRFKIRRLDWDQLRFNEPVDVIFAFALGAGLLWAIRNRLDRRALAEPAVLDMLVLAGTFFALYFVFPVYYGDPGYIDARCLALAGPCLLFACLHLWDGGSPVHNSGRTIAVASAALFACANLVYFAASAAGDDAWIVRYRAVAEAVPRAASVLPVYTRVKQRTRFAFLHDDSLAVIHSAAVIPYMFSGDRGQPMKYFRYQHPSYAPPFDWYSATPSAAVDWHAIGCAYDFLLVLKPFDPLRIGIATTTVAQNSSAALLAVQRQGCDTSASDRSP